MTLARPALGSFARSPHRQAGPSWFDRVLFVALMTGPPKFRQRDPIASLSGAIDAVVIIQIAVWALGGMWVLARVYPILVRRGALPGLNRTQVIGALFIGALSLSAMDAPGVLLTIFSLGQLAVMLGFLWIFTQRYGSLACLRLMFAATTILALMTVLAIYIAPDVIVVDAARIRGDVIADTGIIAAIGLVLCLSSTPTLRGATFWIALVLFGGLLVASRTRSAFVALVAYLVVGFVYGRRLPVRRLVLPLAAIVMAAALLDALSSTTEYLVREPESLENMSDRVPLWQHLTEVVINQAPVTGLGFYSASRVVAADYNPGLGNAHSALFEILVGGGLLSTVLYLVLWSALLWSALRVLPWANGNSAAVATLGLTVLTLLMGITTSAPVQAGPLGFTFWSLTAMLPELERHPFRLRAVHTRATAASMAGVTSARRGAS